MSTETLKISLAQKILAISDNTLLQKVKTLIEKIPNVLIVPITINNSYKFNRWGNFPLPLGVRLKFYVHAPIEPSEDLSSEFFDQIEKTITDAIVLD